MPTAKVPLCLAFLSLALGLPGCLRVPVPDDPDRFVRLDAAGQPLAASAADQAHACVHDARSGLTWAVPRPGDARLDPGHRYSWYDARREAHLGDPGLRGGGACGIERCDTEALLAAVNAAGLCGHADWRLPIREEAIALGKRHGSFALGLDPALFPAASAAEFWTASTFRLYPQSAWAFDPGNGLDRADLKTVAKPVRLVRGTLLLPGRRG